LIISLNKIIKII